MGWQAALDALNPALVAFAQRLQHAIGAERVLLHGPYAWGSPPPNYIDYDLIVVAASFEGVRLLDRPRGLRELIMEAGDLLPVALTCLTPDEFARTLRRPGFVETELHEAIDLLPSPHPVSI